jgi:hypothetical protein
MKALNKIRKGLAREDVEKETSRVALPEFKISIVRVKPQPRKHKVINYGYKVMVDGQVPEMYCFQYLPDPELPEDLHNGYVPAEFSAAVPVDDNMVYFYTREGMTGPEYQVVYSQSDPDGVEDPAPMVLEWRDNVDEIWMETLQRLEDSAVLSENALNFLDADPLWLFGIADPATQRALEKTTVVPMLRCIGQRPCLPEWFSYLNADEEADASFRWVVESFAEVEPPPPWTSFKSVGQVVCYLNNETNETTWQHPFYDYFAQLLNHCRRATTEEHIKLRINRVLWSYEAEAQTDLATQQPLVSPKYVKVLADILSCQLATEPYMVRMLKKFLKAFSQMYHEGELDIQEVKFCLEIVENERAKNEVARQLMDEEEEVDALDPGMSGQVYCVECPEHLETVATCYCPECGDCLCQSCFERLHARGNRRNHEPNYFIQCAICKTLPAKLQCTYTRGKYCVDCFFKKHNKTLPKFLDLKPLKIDYKRSAKLDRKDGVPEEPEFNVVIDNDPEVKESFSKPAPLETTLKEMWHAFYDLRGVKYYYNFETQESMRRPDDEHINLEGKNEQKVKKVAKMETLGQISMSREPRFLPAWKEGQEEPEHKDDHHHRKPHH